MIISKKYIFLAPIVCIPVFGIDGTHKNVSQYTLLDVKVENIELIPPMYLHIHDTWNIYFTNKRSEIEYKIEK